MHSRNRSKQPGKWLGPRCRSRNSSKLQLNLAVVYLISQADPGNRNLGKWERRKLISSIKFCLKTVETRDKLESAPKNRMKPWFLAVLMKTRLFHYPFDGFGPCIVRTRSALRRGIGNKYCPFYLVKMARKVTVSGSC